MKFERVTSGSINIDRCKIPWGWIVIAVDEVMTPMNRGYSTQIPETGYEWRTSVTFVFDPFHWWKIKKVK